MNDRLKFFSNESASVTMRFAYACGAIAIGSIIAAQMLASSAQDGMIAQFASLRANSKLASKGVKEPEIDYETTASIGKRTEKVSINPCNASAAR